MLGRSTAWSIFTWSYDRIGEEGMESSDVADTKDIGDCTEAAAAAAAVVAHIDEGVFGEEGEEVSNIPLESRELLARAGTVGLEGVSSRVRLSYDMETGKCFAGEESEFVRGI